VLAVDPAEAGEARVLPAHVRSVGIGFDAKDQAPRLPISADLAAAERPGGMGHVAESGNIDESSRPNGRSERIGPSGIAPAAAQMSADIEAGPVHRC
jgi:hypothetical protein